MNKQSAITNSLVFGAIPFIGLLASLILTSPQESWIVLLLSSLILITIAKVSQFKKGKWVTFGSADMDKPYNYFYLSGWFLLLIALTIGLAIKTSV
ncbi:MAG: hypothetical protein ACRBHB_18665 [Arenicella sp.]